MLSFKEHDAPAFGKILPFGGKDDRESKDKYDDHGKGKDYDDHDGKHAKKDDDHDGKSKDYDDHGKGNDHGGKHARKDDDCETGDDKWKDHDGGKHADNKDDHHSDWKSGKNDECEGDGSDGCEDLHAVLASLPDVCSLLDCAVEYLDSTSCCDVASYDAPDAGSDLLGA